MRVHYVQHAAFEGPAAILDWARETGQAVTASHLYRGEALPEAGALDLLVVMGGPMSVNDERDYPWLAGEKRLVCEAIAAGRAVLGVCLGAQMIASAMGARVYRGPEKEIGWFPARRVTVEGAGALLPETFTPLHWHGETFDLPRGAVRLAETEAVPNQAFQLGARAVGLQFHLEATPESVGAMVEHTGHEIQGGQRFQQEARVILERTTGAAAATRPVLWQLLNYLAGEGERIRGSVPR